MPQLQLPIFPVGSKNITNEVAVECAGQRVVYVYGLMPVFQHEKRDIRTFRMFTSQLIDNGTVRQADIVKTFGVPLPTVKRYLQLLREQGPEAFFAVPKRRSASVLNGVVMENVASLLHEGRSVPEVARATGIMANTLHKAIRAGRLPVVKKKERTTDTEEVPTKSERSEIDSTAVMGNAATRTLERVAASIGSLLAPAAIEFTAARDVTGGGVLLALPALLATGLLTHQTALYTLPKGYYGLPSIFLLLALMALARIGSLEQLRYQAPGEWGELLGLDRVPEVRTLRAKLKILCQQAGRAALWNAALAIQWMTAEQRAEPVFYADGHVRVYHGTLTDLPKHYIARQRLFQRASVDYWINAMDGKPFLYFNQPVDHGLVAALREDLVPWLEAHAPVSAEHQQRMDADPQVPRFTVIFDREGYSPDLFEELWEKRIAVINYHRYPKEDWPEEEFQEVVVELAGGVKVAMKLAERESLLSRKKVKVREVRKLAEGGRQISIVSTHYGPEARQLAAWLFARWSQENYFRYMRQHYGLDALVEYGTEAMPDTAFTVNPVRRKLEADVKRTNSQLRRSQAKLAAASLEQPLSEPAVTAYQLQQGQLQEQVEDLQKELDALKGQRPATPKHVLVKELPEEFRFTRLRPERKYFLDTIKMISYRAEVSMASIVREKLARSDDAHALLRQIFETEVDLIPESETLTVRIHHLTQRAHDDVIRHLCEELNATETVFPGTKLKLIYKLGSS